MLDDMPTPQVRPIPDAGTLDLDDPAVYLNQPATPDERMLGEQVGLHNGDATPWWMFAKLALRDKKQAVWIGGMEGFFKAIRRYARIGLMALAANLVAIGGYALHWAASNGAAEERSAAQERAFTEYRSAVAKRLDELREDIRELRLALNKLSGYGPQPDPDITIVSK